MNLTKVTCIFLSWLLAFIFLPSLSPIKLLQKKSRLINAVLTAVVIAFFSPLLDAVNRWIDGNFGDNTFNFLIIGLLVVYFIVVLSYSGGKFIKKYSVGEPTINIKKFGKDAKGKRHYCAPKDY